MVKYSIVSTSRPAGGFQPVIVETSSLEPVPASLMRSIRQLVGSRSGTSNAVVRL
jgi:hypothetical protein